MWSDVHSNGNIQFNQIQAIPPVLAQKSMNGDIMWMVLEHPAKFMKAALDYGVIASQFDMLGEQEMADRLKDKNLIICARSRRFYKFRAFIVIYDYSERNFL